ncbi:MAG: hypothetical protein AAGH68_00290 [Pseudomonadota bacterium]
MNMQFHPAENPFMVTERPRVRTAQDYLMSVRAIVEGIWRWGIRLLGFMFNLFAAQFLVVAALYYGIEYGKSACRLLSDPDVRIAYCTRTIPFFWPEDIEDRATLLEERGDAYFKQELYRRAKSDFAAALSLRETAHLYWYRATAQAKINSTRPSSMRAVVADSEQALALGADHPELFAIKGLAHFELEDWKSAFDSLGDAVNAGASGDLLHTVLLERGRAAFELGAYNLAEADFDAVIAAEFDLGRARTGRADSRCRQGNLVGALADIVSLESEAPNMLREVQKTLRARRHYAGPITGRFTDETRTALIKNYNSCRQTPARIAPG